MTLKVSLSAQCWKAIPHINVICLFIYNKAWSAPALPSVSDISVLRDCLKSDKPATTYFIYFKKKKIAWELGRTRILEGNLGYLLAPSDFYKKKIGRGTPYILIFG